MQLSVARLLVIPTRINDMIRNRKKTTERTADERHDSESSEWNVETNVFPLCNSREGWSSPRQFSVLSRNHLLSSGALIKARESVYRRGSFLFHWEASPLLRCVVIPDLLRCYQWTTITRKSWEKSTDILNIYLNVCRRDPFNLLNFKLRTAFMSPLETQSPFFLTLSISEPQGGTRVMCIH